ncbi:MAG: DUF4823 domain-containing protein [Pseudohongiellaceae bacterium]|nr:DUF4823 domain-containing protein [Pseudohongiellaceae bacterium]
MSFKILTVALMTLFLAGCADLQRAYEESVAATALVGVIPRHKVDRTGHWILHRDTSFYVAVSGQQYLETVVPIPSPNTEQRVLNAVSNVLVDEIGVRFPRVLRAQEPQTMFDARMSAISNGIDYVVYPRLLVWQDTAGTWTELADALRYHHPSNVEDSFGLDRARLHLTLMEAGSGRIIDVVQIESRAGLATLYEESPDRLLVAAVGRYVDTLVP